MNQLFIRWYCDRGIATLRIGDNLRGMPESLPSASFSIWQPLNVQLPHYNNSNYKTYLLLLLGSAT